MLEMSEINGWDSEAREAKVTELRVELFKLRMEKSISLKAEDGSSKMKDAHKLKDLKKDIARVMTAQNTKSGKQ